MAGCKWLQTLSSKVAFLKTLPNQRKTHVRDFLEFTTCFFYLKDIKRTPNIANYRPKRCVLLCGHYRLQSLGRVNRARDYKNGWVRAFYKRSASFKWINSQSIRNSFVTCMDNDLTKSSFQRNVRNKFTRNNPYKHWVQTLLAVTEEN